MEWDGMVVFLFSFFACARHEYDGCVCSFLFFLRYAQYQPGGPGYNAATDCCDCCEEQGGKKKKNGVKWGGNGFGVI